MESFPGENNRLRAALEEMQSYLSDSIPPLIFAASVELLSEAPPEVVGSEIVAWATRQAGSDAEQPTADSILRATRKLQMLAELDLLPEAVLRAWFGSLRPTLIEGCASTDRASLIAELDRHDLGSGESPTGVDERADGRAGNESSDSAPLSPLQVDRSQDEETGESALELERLLDELRRRGLHATSDDLVRLLAQSLPDWAAPPAEAGSAEEAPQAAVRAIHLYISMAEDRGVVQRRFDELVATAVEEFNHGSLGRAVTLLGLASQMIERQEIDVALSQSVQRRGQGSIDLAQLRQILDDEENAPLLRRFLSFFPLLSPPHLLRDLEEEQGREQRRYILDLLRVHGSEGRGAAFSDLADAATGGAPFPWYYLRNLVRLLRSMPRNEEDPVEREIDVLVRVSDINGEYPLVREALSSLGQLRHQRSVAGLSVRLGDIETILVESSERQLDREQLYFLLDTTIKALVRLDLPDARRAVVLHGLMRRPELGDTLARLSWLEGQDLSGEGDIVERLVGETRNEMPKKVLGVSLGTGKKAEAVESMLRALSGTDTPTVRSFLQEVVRDSAEQPWTATAGEILLGFDRAAESTDKSAEEPTAKVSGDLALFGLPSLLQNLAESRKAGVLRVFDSDGSTRAELWLDRGMVIGATSGSLTGEVAMFQLLENPAPGHFELDRPEVPPEVSRTGQNSMSIRSSLLEGIRRYDELERAASVAPDEARFRSTGKQPTMGGEETDPEVFREVWRRASTGMSPRGVESEVLVDRYRIRALFEHWIATGVLEPATTDPDSENSKS